MEKKRMVRWFFPLIVLLLLLWWVSPVTFLGHVDAEDIFSIVVHGGETGEGFVITQRDEIARIVENIQSTVLRKEKISTFYSGALWGLYFKDRDGKTVAFLIINSKDCLRRDPFFYKAISGGFCVEDLENLERNLPPLR